MFDALLMHPTTRAALHAFAATPPHALLFIGASGTGKRTLALAWGQQVSHSLPQVVEPDERGTITIETIRELYRTTRTKRDEWQVIIIDHAEAMSLEAENAFLKLLEEPREGVTFVLTTPHTDALLPTILSRTQRVFVQPVTQQTLSAYAAAQVKKPTPAELTQLLFIARGRPAIFCHLLQNAESLIEERNHMQQAKELLTAKPYDRYVFAGAFSGDRPACRAILEAMLQMSSLQLQKPSDYPTTKRWLTLSQALEETLSQLERNANVKAQLLKLFTSY